MTVEPSPARVPGTLLALLVVGLAWAVLQLWGLGLTPFHTRGEPREAVVVQDLVAHNRWILPRRNAVELPRKPPLFYWLAGAAARARGAVDEASVRLPSAVQSGRGRAARHRRRGGDDRTGRGRCRRRGPPQQLRVAARRDGGTRRHDARLRPHVGVRRAAAVPPTRAHRVVVSGVRRCRLGDVGQGDPRPRHSGCCRSRCSASIDRSLAPLRRLHPLRGVLFVAIVAGAWYAAAAAQGGRAFLTIVANENVVRIVGAKSASLGHVHGLGYLVGALLAGLLPWTLLLPSTALALWRDRASARPARPAPLRVAVEPGGLCAVRRREQQTRRLPVAAVSRRRAADRLVGAARVARTRQLGRPARVLIVVLWALAILCALLAVAAAAERAGIPLLAWLPELGRGRSVRAPDRRRGRLPRCRASSRCCSASPRSPRWPVPSPPVSRARARCSCHSPF